MKIAIVGGGICGLSAAYFLSQKNHQVFIFEKEKSLGGLTGSFTNLNWNWPLEKFYHHFFSSDIQLTSLAEELQIKDKLKFKTPITSVFIQNKIYQFDSPMSLFKFPLLTISDKIRTGIVTAFLKFSPFWKPLEKIPAFDFIKRTMGKNSYQKIWEPLLVNKFGSFYKDIPASWFWTRVKKRSFSLGYFEGGNQILIDKLAEKIKNSQGKIFLHYEIKNLNDLNFIDKFDKTVVTAPMQVFLKITSGLQENHQEKIKNLKMIGCLNLILSVKEKFLTDNTYWLNINDPSFPFVAVVEHTNFINPAHYGGEHLLYIGGYYPQNHRYFKMKKEDILKEFLPYLKKINPEFNFELCTLRHAQGKLLHFELFFNLYAQPIPSINYSQTQLPEITTPIPNLYWTSLHHVYPEDRGVNYAIKLGKKIADEILSKSEK